MSDILSLGNSYSDVEAPGAPSGYSGGSPVDTGSLRRKYNFGNRVSELSIAQDPFFRFLSKVAKKPTDDPLFKFTERRGSWHKRYAYVFEGGAALDTPQDTTIANSEAESTIYLTMGTDYASSGNKTNIYGKSVDYVIGQAGTKPVFFLPDQLIRIPVCSASNVAHDQVSHDYMIVKVLTVADDTNYVSITGSVVKGFDNSTVFFMHEHSSVVAAGGTTTASEETLAPYKCYVMGSVFGQGTGFPETWKDQPWSTSYGQTQIWKTSMAMDNTDRATVLRYAGNEWARIWKEKLIEHKWDIEQSLLFGSQNATYRTTQGAVDWIVNNGNAFTLDTATATADKFLDDMSALLDPRYNNAKATVFFCSTDTFNWLHKLGGFFSNNIEISSNYRADLAVTGRKKVLGLDTTTISTVYGDMNLVRNIHLDGTNVRILGINMSHCKYRPLVGNGLNRDTSIYVGVQTLENTGVDRRVDQILTEAGMEWGMPEAHAIWTDA